VVQAALKSGSLITARLAGEQGREVMAVPGAPGTPGSEGCNALLRDGAALIESVVDISTALGWDLSLADSLNPRHECNGRCCNCSWPDWFERQRMGIFATCNKQVAAMTASWWHLRRAVQTLRSGGLIAHATEGVWGLACDPDNLAAVARILHLKDRAMSKGLLLLGAHPDTFAAELAELSAADRATALAAWPGPSTFVLPNSRRPHWPHWITGDHSGVALRVPGHAQARALCNGFGGPLVSTSANPAGRRAADTDSARR